MQAFMNALSPGYFETMGIKVLEGRDFRTSDIVERPKIAIVNRKFAQHFFGDKSAIGRRWAADWAQRRSSTSRSSASSKTRSMKVRAKAYGARSSGRDLAAAPRSTSAPPRRLPPRSTSSGVK
jgi:hypothetical protein